MLCSKMYSKCQILLIVFDLEFQKTYNCCFFWRWFMLSIVWNCLAGRFLFPLMACSRPSYPSPFSSGDIAAPPSCVLVSVYSGFLVKVLTSRKAARWSCILFPLAKGEVRWGEVRWGEVRWGEVRWGEVRWGEVRWGEVRWR